MKFSGVPMLRLYVALSVLIFTSLYACASDAVVLKPVLKNIEGLPQADLKAIIQDLNKHNYANLDEVAEDVRFVFQKYGYFKVQVADPILPRGVEVRERNVIPIDVFVTTGSKYRLSDIGFPNSTVFSASELRAAFPILDGEVFDRDKIAFGFEKLRRLYALKGYMFFSAVPETNVDESAQTISLRIDLDEGPLFYAGRLTVKGVESQPGAREKLLKTWKAYEGRVYELGTLDRFLLDLGARRAVRPEQVFEVSFDANTHMANVYITLAKPIF